jgi:hypothetical protein
MSEPREFTPIPNVEKRQADQFAPPQVRLLTSLIESDPDAPVHYLLRGEEWLVCGQFERARADFLTARAQAEKLLSESLWGYIYQAYMDRAETGIYQCKL